MSIWILAPPLSDKNRRRQGKKRVYGVEYFEEQELFNPGHR
jgi:hypothetical protein